MALDNLRVLPIALCLMASADSNAQTTAAAGAIAGGVFVLNPDGVAYIPGAKIILQGPETLQTETDDSGQYSFHKVQPGNYTIEARFPNLEAIQEVMIPSGAVTKLNLELKPVAVTTSVTVADTEKAPTNPETITAKTVANAPNVKERFRSLLPLLPGVVRGPDGRINMKGARNTQSGALVNSANVTDPATGSPAINLPIDVVSSVQVISNPYDPQYGKLTGAVSSVETKTGNYEGVHFTIQNILPRLRDRNRGIVGIGAVIPRMTFTGRASRSGFHDSLLLTYKL